MNCLWGRDNKTQRWCASVRRMTSSCPALCSCPAWCHVRRQSARWSQQSKERHLVLFAAVDILKALVSKFGQLFWELLWYINSGTFIIFLLMHPASCQKRRTERRADFSWNLLMCQNFFSCSFYSWTGLSGAAFPSLGSLNGYRWYGDRCCMIPLLVASEAGKSSKVIEIAKVQMACVS